MYCPICKENRLVFHVGDGEVLAIDCESGLQTCKFEKGTDLFKLLEKAYDIITSKEQQEHDMRLKFAKDIQRLHVEYEFQIKEVWYATQYILGVESAQQTFESNGVDSAPPQAVSKPGFLSTLAAFLKPTHRR